MGHESDFTICDFVADCRAATPSAAAELAVPDRRELLLGIGAVGARMQSAMQRNLEASAHALEVLRQSRVLSKPATVLDPFGMHLGESERRLAEGFSYVGEQKTACLAGIAGKLEALSPLAVLRRGYAVVHQNEKTVTRAAAVAVGDALTIRFADGSVSVRAEAVEGEDQHG